MERYKILPGVTHKGIRVVAAALMLASLFTICLLAAGCEPRVKSPFSGADVTSAELIGEAHKEARRIDAEHVEKIAAAERLIRETRRKALVRANAIAANVDQSKAEADRLLAELRITTEADISGAEVNLEAAHKAVEVAIADLEETTNDALAEAERKRQQALGAFNLIAKIPVVGQAAASAGIDPAGIGAVLFGGGGLAYMARRGSRRRDEAYDEGYAKAKAEAEAARDREHQAWEESQKAILLLHAKPPTP